MEAAVVEKLDEAWRSRGIKSRTEFFRGALGH
jgi:metal-responsive CopG/Arc/MetJ family transcriptional regulator